MNTANTIVVVDPYVGERIVLQAARFDDGRACWQDAHGGQLLVPYSTSPADMVGPGWTHLVDAPCGWTLCDVSEEHHAIVRALCDDEGYEVSHG